VPPAVTNSNDADDNSAFHATLNVMDFGGTISTEVALYHNKEEYDDLLTLGLPLGNAGKAFKRAPPLRAADRGSAAVASRVAALLPMVRSRSFFVICLSTKSGQVGACQGRRVRHFDKRCLVWP
jgi:hypothetical protein